MIYEKPEPTTIPLEKPNFTSQCIIICAWAEDFWKAFMEKPKIFRWIVKIIVGRYAWTELMGMKSHFDTYMPYIFQIGYGLEKIDYNSDKELYNYKNY